MVKRFENHKIRESIDSVLDIIYHLYCAATGFRSGGSVVNNTLDYESRNRWIDSRSSGLSDETLNRGPVSV